jgi:hypothetical protein
MTVTFLKWSPSFITGAISNILSLLMTNCPCSMEYISLLMRRRSEHDLTGRKRFRGTLIPCEFLKCLIAAPAAVSSCRKNVTFKAEWQGQKIHTWMTAFPSSVTLGLVIISSSMASVSIIRFRAAINNYVRRKSGDEDVRTLEVNPKIVRVEYLELTD